MWFFKHLFRGPDKRRKPVTTTPLDATVAYPVGEAERLVGMYSAQIADLQRQLAAAQNPKSAKESKSVNYYDYLGHIPVETLNQIKENAGALSPTVRGMLLAIWAVPQDRARWMAMSDYIQEFITLPDAVTVGGQKVAIDQQLTYEWWRSKTSLHADALRGLLVKYGKEGPNGQYHQNTWYRHRHRTMSLADICVHTEAEIGDIDGIGPQRLAKLRQWLRSLGLRLAGDEVVQPKPKENEEGNKS